MMPYKLRLILIGSHLAVGVGAAVLTIALLPRPYVPVEGEYHRPMLSDAVKIVAQVEKIDEAQVRARYRPTMVALADRLCIGFDRIEMLLDGGPITVCYPKHSSNAGPVVHVDDRATSASNFP